MDLLETDDMQSDLGKFLRNFHYLLAAVLKQSLPSQIEIQILKLAQSIIQICPYDKMRPKLINHLTDGLIVKLEHH